jgi:uncharacterized membrane protein YeaQ/YmgE (transglycosylase-associated protein family)
LGVIASILGDAAAGSMIASWSMRSIVGRAVRTMEVAMIYFLIFGLVVGALARFIVPGRESGGWLLSLLLGVAGSFAGTFLGRAMGLYREGAPAGFIMSLLGAILLLVAYHAFARRRWAR